MILVAGEALVDLASTNFPEFRAHCGGGPFNTARALGRLGQPVGFLGCISDDPFGTRLRRALSDDDVALDCAVATPLPTTLAFAELDRGGAAQYRFYIDGTSAPALTPRAALAALPPSIEMLHVGTLGLVLEPMASALAATVEAVAGRALIMVDPNIRPSVVRDRSSYLARLDGVLSHAHVVKASEEDLAWIEPDVPALDAAQRLLNGGPTVVLLTRGAEGTSVVTARERITVPAPATEIADTIGAGDAFGAGFLACWRDRGLGAGDLGDVASLVEAARFACLVASKACERAGASAPLLAEVAS